MCGDLKRPYWGGPVPEWPHDVLADLGVLIDDEIARFPVGSGDHALVRQAVAHLRGPTRPPLILAPFPLLGEAPITPNTFPDGSCSPS